ncbi:MAG: protein translocase subunit SecF [archaeon]
MTQEQGKNWHDKHYKKLMILPIFVLVLALIFLFVFYQQTGDILIKDISLTGGTSITVQSETDVNQLELDLSPKLPDLTIRRISDLRTGRQLAFIVETSLDSNETKTILQDYLGFDLTEENSSIEFTGSTLSASFYKQLRLAIIIAFVLMSLVVFIIFRTFIPSLAVIFAAFSDIVISLVIVDILGIKLSAAGIVAFLMLIGYSVDSDILLTTRVLRTREGSVNERLLSGFKTGITMTFTSLVAVLVSLAIVYSLSEILTQIFMIISIGLVVDIFITYIGNLGILKWYAEIKRL